jgi:hypothetical protein
VSEVFLLRLTGNWQLATGNWQKVLMEKGQQEVESG